MHLSEVLKEKEAAWNDSVRRSPAKPKVAFRFFLHSNTFFKYCVLFDSFTATFWYFFINLTCPSSRHQVDVAGGPFDNWLHQSRSKKTG